LNVSIIGDILHSRVARQQHLGTPQARSQVTIAGPATLVPREFERLGVRVCYNLRDALEGADVINLLRIQHERQRADFFPSTSEYARVFGLGKDSQKFIKPDALIMHPGPINRGVELDSSLADGPQSVILQQVTNGLAVRMAVLFLVAGCLK
jgi:aspartate carbamoyltransferase catalytic subunit